MTRRIIVFRFDRNPWICRQRIALLRKLNPGMLICGLYGGPHAVREHAFRKGAKTALGLDNFWASPHDPTWNWKNGDLALVNWFRDVGRRLEFDVAHLVEWDLVLMQGVAEAYSGVPADRVGLTALTAISEVNQTWEWLATANGRAEWQALQDFIGERWATPTEQYACIGVGPCFPKSFLAAYADQTVPVLAHDELRLPLLAQAMGFSLADTGLRRSWDSEAENSFFNASGKSISLDTIKAELAKPNGRRAFHPVRLRLPNSIQKHNDTEA